MKQMKMKTKVIPLSETTELESNDLLYLRHHAKLVFNNLERKLKLQNNNDQYEHEHEHEHEPPPPLTRHQQQKSTAWFDDDDGNNNNTKEEVRGKEEGNNKDDDQHQNQHQQQQQDQQRLRYFNSYGFCIERQFCNKNEIHQLKNAMSKSVQQNWFPNTNDNDNDNDNEKDDNDNDEEKETTTTTESKTATVTFGTDAKSNEARGDPFLESSNKVSYFMEPTAMDSLTGKLKSHYEHNNNGDSKANKKLLALCKAGHGLHLPSLLGTTTTSSSGNNDKERKEEEEEVEEDNNNNNKKKKTNIHAPFFNYSTSNKLQSLVFSLGYIDPVIAQSMYIFKNPIVGGAVHTHQDSTFLYTTPKQTCLGLWLALDDATLTNGCLWIRPKSHLETVRRQFIRNPMLYNTNNTDTDENKNENDENGENDENNASPSPSSPSSPPPSKLVFRNHYKDPNVTWEGKLPDSVEVVVFDDEDDDDEDDEGGNGADNSSDNDEFDEDEDEDENENENDNSNIISSSLNFVPVEVKAGDLVVFCGTLDHFSLPNFSEKQRHTFQLHLVEGPNAGITWSPENWLQYDDDDENNKKKNKNNNGDNNTSTSSHINFLRLLDYTDK